MKMLSHDLMATLVAHRNNDVVAKVNGVRVPIVGLSYDPLGNQIVLELDPEEMKIALAPDLADDDDGYHVIDLRKDGWTLKHPLSCRPNLFDCPVNRAVRDINMSPVLGRYTRWLDDEGEVVIDLRGVRQEERDA